jgi:hypothetical protein
MTADENPANWHTDDYLRDWARKLGLDCYPVCDVAILSASRSDPDTARIHWNKPDVPVERFRSPTP